MDAGDVAPTNDVALLRAVGLSVAFGGVQALRRVDLEVGTAEVVGLIGPNGAGKTTFIDAVSGFLPAIGQVILDGQEVQRLAADKRARRGLVRTFQSAETFAPLTVTEHLLAATESGGLGRALLDLVLPRRGARPDMGWVLDELGLGAVADRYPDDLSYGQRKLLDLARALVTRPRVVLLDEPAAGLDTTETAELAGLLRSVRARGIGVLLVDHDMDLVLEVCDRVYVLDFGRIIASGTPDAIRSDPAVIDAYLGATP
ncbi:MAG: lptB 6 [Ilumatobacteraceae bacterium]|nr:lptB 6 [Ilumatobacteraceae bacterium]